MSFERLESICALLTSSSKYTGDATVWYNAGEIPTSGSHFKWELQGDLYKGWDRGANMHFGALGGQHRADMIQVQPRGNAAYVSYNECDGGGGGDDANMDSVQLPDYAGTTSPGGIFQETDPTTTDPTTTNPLYAYKTHTCDLDIVQYASKYAPEEVWDGLDCTPAWSDAVGYWETDDDKQGNEFTEDLASFFNITTHSWKCQTFIYGDTTQCRAGLSCDQSEYPAGWVIMNSIGTLESILASVAQAMDSAKETLMDQAEDLISAFGNLPEDDKALDIFLTILDVGFSLTSTPVFDKALKSVQAFKQVSDETLASFKDTSIELSTKALEFISPDDSDDALLSETAELKDNIAAIVTTWHTALTEYNSQLFNGSTNSILELWHIIFDGYLFSEGGDTATDDLISDMESALFPMLIAASWKLGDNPAFIVDTQLDCDGADPSYIDSPSTQGVCIDGKAYYIGSVEGDSQFCDGDLIRPVCSTKSFSAPAGLDQLDGTKWGGVTFEDFVIGSVNSYTANGNKNGVSTLGIDASQLYDDSDVPAIVANPVQIAGVLTLPVCTSDEAYDNWGGDVTDNYPCN